MTLSIKYEAGVKLVDYNMTGHPSLQCHPPVNTSAVHVFHVVESLQFGCLVDQQGLHLAGSIKIAAE